MDLNEFVNNHEADEIYVCPICGSPDVDVREWRNVNTGDFAGQDETSSFYCNGCFVYFRKPVTMEQLDKEFEKYK